MEDGRQFGRPSGEEGRKILQDMNEHHRPLMAWALSKLPVISPAEILDIGCGGGMFLKMLSEAYPDAGMTGADISPEALALTRETNQEAVSSGRLVTVLASVSDLPFHGGVFDLVTAMETYFFWPDLAKGLAEAARTLRDGGCMLIASEQYPHPDFKKRNDRNAELTGFRLVENGEMKRLMEKRGIEVEIHTEEDRNWVAFIGRKSIIPLI